MKKKSLSVSVKLLLINLSYLVPVVVMIYFMVKVNNDNIKFATWEQYGNGYQTPVEGMLQNLGKHAWVSQRFLGGDSTAKALLTDLQSRIDQDFKAVSDAQDKFGDYLQFTHEGLKQRKRDHVMIPTLKREWDELKNSVYSLKPEVAAEKHVHLIGDLRTIITHLGDTSNLILDPDLDSYYLMDVTLLALPQMQDRLIDLTYKVEQVLRKKKVTPEEKTFFTAAVAFLAQADRDRVTADMQTVINEDGNFGGISESLQKTLPPMTAELASSLDPIIKSVEHILTAPAITEDPVHFSRLAEVAYDKSFSFWKASAHELDQLLAVRIEGQAQTRNQMIYLSLFALFCSACASTFLGRSIRNGILLVVNNAIEIMQGISSVMETSNKQLLETANALSTGTSDQASAIQETVSAIEEINNMSGQTATNANKSVDETRSTQQVAESTRGTVKQMVGALGQISDSNTEMISRIRDSNEKIFEIVHMIKNIGERTKVINDIVFQTKLLSFNASVEAARAGEHGKGFAVVAEEVGNLAQMSGNAAKEISSLLDESIKRVTTTIEGTRDALNTIVAVGKDKIDHGVGLVKQCEETLDNALNRLANVSQFVTDIASANREQATGMSEISKAISQFETTTHRNVESAESTTSLAKELNEQAELLSSAIVDLEMSLGNTSKADKQGTGGVRHRSSPALHSVEDLGGHHSKKSA